LYLLKPTWSWVLPGAILLQDLRPSIAPDIHPGQTCKWAIFRSHAFGRVLCLQIPGWRVSHPLRRREQPLPLPPVPLGSVAHPTPPITTPYVPQITVWKVLTGSKMLDLQPSCQNIANSDLPMRVGLLLLSDTDGSGPRSLTINTNLPLVLVRHQSSSQCCCPEWRFLG
jgi:hypothetical protein